MKKILLLGLIFSFLTSCLDNKNLAAKYLPIDSFETPISFTYRTVDTIKIKYSLPNSCHSYHSLYYQYQDTARIIAIRALEDLESACIEQVFERELIVPIQVTQRQSYVFKFWKGKDSNGQDLYEEKVVPVN